MQYNRHYSDNLGKAKLLTTKQAAELYNVSPLTIRKWCINGKLKHTKIGKNYKIITSDKQDGTVILSACEVAKLFNVCLQTVYNWAHSGAIKSKKYGGIYLFFIPQSFVDFFDAKPYELIMNRKETAFRLAKNKNTVSLYAKKNKINALKVAKSMYFKINKNQLKN